LPKRFSRKVIGLANIWVREDMGNMSGVDGKVKSFFKKKEMWYIVCGFKKKGASLLVQHFSFLSIF
jgi:hypothetical protein